MQAVVVVMMMMMMIDDGKQNESKNLRTIFTSAHDFVGSSWLKNSDPTKVRFVGGSFGFRIDELDRPPLRGPYPSKRVVRPGGEAAQRTNLELLV